MGGVLDGYRSLQKICEVSQLGRDVTLRILAKLKLAGIITATERKPVPVSTTKAIAAGNSQNLETMVSQLATLFENYLTARAVNRPEVKNIRTTVLGEPR